MMRTLFLRPKIALTHPQCGFRLGVSEVPVLTFSKYRFGGEEGDNLCASKVNMAYSKDGSNRISISDDAIDDFNL